MSWAITWMQKDLMLWSHKTSNSVVLLTFEEVLLCKQTWFKSYLKSIFTSTSSDFYLFQWMSRSMTSFCIKLPVLDPHQNKTSWMITNLNESLTDRADAVRLKQGAVLTCCIMRRRSLRLPNRNGLFCLNLFETSWSNWGLKDTQVKCSRLDDFKKMPHPTNCQCSWKENYNV